MKMRKTLMMLAVAVLPMTAACEGGGTGSDKPKYPEVEGVYDVSAPLTELPGARFSGTMTITDDSRDTPTFGGSYTFSILYEGENFGTGSGVIVGGTIDTNGQMSFNLDDNTFRVNGKLSGRAFNGTFIISDPEGNYTGTFTASRR